MSRPEPIQTAGRWLVYPLRWPDDVFDHVILCDLEAVGKNQVPMFIAPVGYDECDAVGIARPQPGKVENIEVLAGGWRLWRRRFMRLGLAGTAVRQ